MDRFLIVEKIEKRYERAHVLGVKKEVTALQGVSFSIGQGCQPGAANVRKNCL
jgi:hypothetical protein